MESDEMQQPEHKLTKIALKVLRGLENENHALKPEELVEKLNLNLRSVRYGLKLLLDADIIVKQPDLGDLRSNYYIIRSRITNPYPAMAET